MKRTLSLFLAVFLLISALIVPVDFVSAAADLYADNYTYSFKPDDVYSYTSLKKGAEAEGTLSFTPASNVGSVSVVPLYGSTNYINNWADMTAEHKVVSVDGIDYDAIKVVSNNDAVFVPITSEGKPFELAPGHTYTVTVAYTHTGNATNDNWYANRGLYVGGGLYKPDTNANKYARHFAKVNAFGDAPASMPYGQKVDDLLSIDSTGIIEKTVSFTTPSATGDGYTYYADKNAYSAEVECVSASGGAVVGDKYTLDFYNYFYLYFDHYGTSEINITALKITRDDYAPDWSEVLEDKYVFDVENFGYFADVPNKSGQSVIDSSIDWTYSPVSVNPGHGRGNRNIYPVYSNASTMNWGPQTWAAPSTVEYDGETVNTWQIENQNPSYFTPLKDDGTPFELAPGHTYTVKLKYYMTSYESGSPFLQCEVGVPSDGKLVMNSSSMLLDSSLISTRIGWIYGEVGQLSEKSFTITTPAKDDVNYNYNASQNTYTKNIGGVDCTLYNYLYFSLTNYGKPTIDIVSLEIVRDDYVVKSTVNYIDSDGTVLKTVETNAGEYKIAFTPSNKADKVFAGWYLDEAYNTPAGTTVNIPAEGLNLYAKWNDAVNWSEVLDKYYSFDMSKMGNYTDVANSDTSINWTLAPVSVDAGFGRGNRDIYPTNATTSKMGWGAQAYAYKSTTTYNNKEVDAVTFVNRNPGYFIPLKEDGKPFELAPGHTYTVKYVYEAKAIEGGTPIMQVSSGIASDGTLNVKQHSDGIYYNDISYNCISNAWVASDLGNFVEKTCTIKAPALDDANYSVSDNTYKLSYDGTEYSLYNYLYFNMGNYGKATVNFISIEVIRDDYAADGTVEYIDADGSVIKSVTQKIGDYAIDFVPENTDEKYFAGWYLDEARQQRVETATLSLSESGLKIYAKWEEYKTSVVSTNHGRYYGTTYVPYVTAAGVYNYQMSNRSNVGQTTLTTSNKEYIGMTTSFWGDGMLITAVDDETGELFRAKPNTAYKISLKFRITAETTRADGIDVNIAAGAGLPENSSYPTGKYYDENSLKNRTSYTKYTDKLTAEGKFETYTAVYTTGDFTTIPAIGVELWLYQDAAIEIYSLSVSEFDGEDVSDGEFLVSKEVKNNTTYMINFDYALNSTPNKDIGIGFKTTASDTVGYPTYIEGENVAIYTVKADKPVDEWFTATVLITTDMTANVVNSFGYDDVITALNTNLYGYIISENLFALSIKNIKISEIKDSFGNDLINAVGAQCLTADAEKVTGSQALRYSFTYDTKTGNEIFINGNEYKIKERGFIYVNGNNYAKGGLYKADFNLTNAKAGKYKFNSKTTALDVCWMYSAIENTALYSLAFSTYVKDFDLDDTKELMVKAYVIIEIDGQQFTVYSDSVNRSVAYLKSLA